MQYSMSFGKLTAQLPVRKAGGGTFGVAVLGDFSGRANRGELEKGAALANRKPRRVDIDNLDSVLESMQLKLCLPIGDDGGAVEIEISSMDDFHPDELFDKVEIFSELANLRKRLKNTSSFAAAAAEVRSWGDLGDSTATRIRPKARGSAIPNAKVSDFARLMGRATAVVEETPADELIKQIVRPYVTQAASPDQQQMLAAVDSALAAAMRRVLHHPDFQTLEALWRSVDLLIRELETDGNLQVILYDISAEEIAADLCASDNLEEAGLYKLLVEQPALDLRTTPPSVIVGNYNFEQSPPHAELLGRIAQIAAAAQAPFFAAISNEVFEKKKPEEIHPLVLESWSALRSLPHSVYLGLTVPRFMLRWPYGAKTEPISPFNFEEFSPQFGLKGFLWGNSAMLAGLLLGKTFSQQGLGDMKLGSVAVQGDMPIYYYTDKDGDQIALPCTERLASEAVAAHIIKQGFMPILWMRGRPEVRMGSFNSVNGPMLAGPWAPVQVAAGAVVAAPAAAAATAPVAVEEAAPAVEVDEAPPAAISQSVADLDALLGELDFGDDAAASPAESSVTGGEDDLDALLASIEGDGEADEPASDEGEMDPDLAALLAAL
jgi:type VI secretion system protein ImpC